MKCSTKENIAIALGALVSAIATGVLSVSFAALIMILASQIAVRMAFGQTRPAVELEGAIAREQVDGDLKSAIAIYQKIAADDSAPRDVRAKALLHLAGCYEKLGQQAQTVYQQIVRDFADQPAAAQARARLAALKQDDHPTLPATMTQRKIEMPGVNPGPGDTDGRRAVYLNKAGELIYSDLAGKMKRVILKVKPTDQLGFSPSRDFSMVLLQSLTPDQEIDSVVKTDGTGYREIAKLDGQYGCHNWSWDNRYVLICSNPYQAAPIGLLRVSVADGRIRELVAPQTKIVVAATFSPDGRFVAYQVAASAKDPVARILVRPVEGGEPQLIYQEQPTTSFAAWAQPIHLLDWTADGRYLAIASERTGKVALYLLPIKSGKSAAEPVFLKYGDFEEGTTTATGGLVYSSVKPGGSWTVYVAALESSGRLGDWKRLDLALGNKQNPWPQWFGDSKQIAYIAEKEDAGQLGGEVIHLYDLSNGEDREIHGALRHATCTAAVQHLELFCEDRTARETNVFSIAVDSGRVELLHTFPASALVLQRASRDDRALYIYRYLKDTDEGAEVLRWDIATQRETILEQLPPRTFGSVSPDERWLVRLDKQNLEIRPTSGGSWKSLVSLRLSTGHINATPDGNWLLYQDEDFAGKYSLFRVATTGGHPERLGDFPTNSVSGNLEVSPDGRKIIVASGDYATGTELWSLENFVPPAPKQ